MEKRLETGNPGPTMLFIFTMLTIMFWGQATGFLKPESSLFLGAFMLMCFPAYLFGGIYFISKGDSVSGNVYLIFATCFGGIGGILNLLEYFARLYGWPVDPTIAGFVWLWSGIAIIPILAAMLRGPLLPLIIFSLGSVELIMMGLVSLGILPASAYSIITWFFLVVGVGGFYCSLAELFSFAGVCLPQGKPLYKLLGNG